MKQIKALLLNCDQISLICNYVFLLKFLSIDVKIARISVASETIFACYQQYSIPNL